MINAIRRFLGQVDRREVNPENVVYTGNRTPAIPSDAIKVFWHIPMFQERRSISLENDIVLEWVHPGESLENAMARMRQPFADATILDAIVLARLNGTITFPSLWIGCFIVFPGTVFQYPNWEMRVSGLNMVSRGVDSMRGMRTLGDPVTDAHPVFIACAASTI